MRRCSVLRWQPSPTLALHSALTSADERDLNQADQNSTFSPPAVSSIWSLLMTSGRLCGPLRFITLQVNSGCERTYCTGFPHLLNTVGDEYLHTLTCTLILLFPLRTASWLNCGTWNPVFFFFKKTASWYKKPNGCLRYVGCVYVCVCVYVWVQKQQLFHSSRGRSADRLRVLSVQVNLEPRWEQYSVKWFVNYTKPDTITHNYSHRHQIWSSLFNLEFSYLVQRGVKGLDLRVKKPIRVTMVLSEGVTVI